MNKPVYRSGCPVVFMGFKRQQQNVDVGFMENMCAKAQTCFPESMASAPI